MQKSPENEIEFKGTAMKRPKRRQIVIGNDKDETVEGGPKNVDHPVHRLDKETTTESFNKLIHNNFSRQSV